MGVLQCVISSYSASFDLPVGYFQSIIGLVNKGNVSRESAIDKAIGLRDITRFRAWFPPTQRRPSADGWVDLNAPRLDRGEIGKALALVNDTDFGGLFQGVQAVSMSTRLATSTQLHSGRLSIRLSFMTLAYILMASFVTIA